MLNNFFWRRLRLLILNARPFCGCNRQLFTYFSLALCLGLHNPSLAGQSKGKSEAFSFEMFLNAVLNSNRSLIMAQLDEEVARENITEQFAIYEPKLTVRSSTGNTLSPLSVEDQLLGRSPDPYPDKQTDLKGTISKLLSYGTKISIDSSLNRQKAGTMDNYQYRSDLRLSIVQPLMRGAGAKITNMDITIAELEAKIQEHLTLDQRNLITTQAAIVYIDALKTQLILERLKARVAILTKLKTEVSTLIKNGRLPRSSEIDIEINLNKLENLISNTERDLIRFKTELILLAPEGNLTVDKIQFDPSILPTKIYHIPDWQQLYTVALNTRHDIKAQKVAIKRALLQLDQASDMARDTLDIRLDAGWSQQAGTATSALRINDMAGHPERRISIEYRMPLGANKGANAKIRKASLEKRKAELLLQDQRQNLENEALVGHKTALQTEKVWLNARKIANSTKKQLEVASLRLVQGRGNIIEVLQSEEKNLEATINEVEASTQYAKAFIQLYSVQGDLSEQVNNIFGKK